jgi:glyoxylase-like metal-dependent hydrolase (beta-lactamase superfamily II)
MPRRPDEATGHTAVGFALLLGEPIDGHLGPDVVRFAFTGDTILIGGIGRTDFASSSGEALYTSIRRLPQLLGAASVICPTHDFEDEGLARGEPFTRRVGSFRAEKHCTSCASCFPAFLISLFRLTGPVDPADGFFLRVKSGET